MNKKNQKTVQSAYAAAGVDIDEMDRGLKAIKKAVSSTRTAGAISEIGSFGGLFRSPGRGQVLVASTDGVGTAHLAAPVFASVVKGMCKACRENDCTLLGGETAEMPGLYPEGEYDLVGTIIGVVDEKRIVTGQKIRPGDVLIGLPSTGLQTNGYSLARKIIFEQEKKSLKDLVPGTKRTFEDVLLAVHGSVLKPVLAVRESGARIRGMAHITGGGLVDNVPRMLPKTVDAVFDRSSWKVPPIFTWLQEKGGVDPMEMFRVFNMGIGYVMAVPRQDAAKALNALERAKAAPIVAGTIESGTGITRFN